MREECQVLCSQHRIHVPMYSKPNINIRFASRGWETLCPPWLVLVEFYFLESSFPILKGLPWGCEFIWKEMESSQTMALSAKPFCSELIAVEEQPRLQSCGDLPFTP